MAEETKLLPVLAADGWGTWCTHSDMTWAFELAGKGGEAGVRCRVRWERTERTGGDRSDREAGAAP